MRSRQLAQGVGAVFVLVCLAFAVSWWLGRTEIRVVNQSGHKLDALQITFPGGGCDFQGVARDAERACHGRASHDGYIAITYRASSSSERSIDTGEYVNFTFGWRGILILRPDGQVDIRREE